MVEPKPAAEAARARLRAVLAALEETGDFAHAHRWPVAERSPPLPAATVAAAAAARRTQVWYVVDVRSFHNATSFVAGGSLRLLCQQLRRQRRRQPEPGDGGGGAGAAAAYALLLLGGACDEVCMRMMHSLSASGAELVRYVVTPCTLHSLRDAVLGASHSPYAV